MFEFYTIRVLYNRQFNVLVLLKGLRFCTWYKSVNFGELNREVFIILHTIAGSLTKKEHFNSGKRGHF